MVTAADPIERARTLLRLRRPADAERELRGLLAQEPQHTVGHALLSLALIEQRRADEAVQEAQESVRLAPDQWLPHYAAAQVYNRARRPDDAVTAVRAALELSPEYAPAWEVLARAHLSKAEWQPMLDAALRGLSIEPEDCDLVSLVSLAYLNLGDPGQARAAAAHAVRIDPESPTAHFVYGRAELRFGDPRRAAESFREVLRLDPGFGAARDWLVRALKERNPVYRRLSRLRGRFPQGWRLIFLLPVIPPVIAVFVILALLHWVAWVAEAWSMLRLARGRATRLLFEGAEARVAVACLGLVAAGAVLLGLGIGLGQEALGVAGASVMALVTPVQEAAHTGSPRGRAILYGWAGLLGVAVVVSVLVAEPGVALLALYASIATVWLATPVRGRLTPAV
ncbi:tetratricopeptide repeat protein [Nonomuraea gerenzanensis]|uniref:TPR repeat n=1 Tax=Nonomuraea gerenzanensis TaxID=93944 RepID=A0A1M4ERP0_9ACTN|nr:tetratricopeptide repeat protein [Nonomuraea gerenzanensis]UBU12738.1 tetratricopeptide repeat protein [Nonomuraea gerenzanensis]SBP01293.1 TPR repeat [Nonomuraea gerenzanensis]